MKPHQSPKRRLGNHAAASTSNSRDNEGAPPSDTLLARFLRYVQMDTQSDDSSVTCPSTPGQMALQEMLRAELVAMGAADVRLTQYGYLMATLPATSKRMRIPTVALLAHVDTAPDCLGRKVVPIVHRNYAGGVIRFPDNRRLSLDPVHDPALLKAKGKDIVTASGATLLGADDKAGVAVIMTLADHLLHHPELEHGVIRLCFTPDEEIGRGVNRLDLKELKADFAYTLDGSGLGEISWETFSADAATVTIEGVSIHPGEAKAKGMVNAAHLAARLLTSLPREHCAPETTADREGFIHPTHIEGGVKETVIHFILRDFELSGLAQKRAILQALCRGLQAAEPRARITLRIRKQYRNMAYWLRENMTPVEVAREAIRAMGMSPTESPVRGGTDGSRLTERGLPTPNLFCGEHNAHGPLEWVAVQDMELAVQTCVRLVELWARRKSE